MAALLVGGGAPGLTVDTAMFAVTVVLDEDPTFVMADVPDGVVFDTPPAGDEIPVVPVDPPTDPPAEIVIPLVGEPPVAEPPVTVEPPLTVVEPPTTVVDPLTTVVVPPITEVEPPMTVALVEPVPGAEEIEVLVVVMTSVEPPLTVVEPPTTIVDPLTTVVVPPMTEVEPPMTVVLVPTIVDTPTFGAATAIRVICAQLKALGSAVNSI